LRGARSGLRFAPDHRRNDLIQPECRLKEPSVTKYLHTMIRVTDPDATIRFFELLGLKETRRMESEKGRFTLIFWRRRGRKRPRWN
jgi:hypothetical protein